MVPENCQFSYGQPSDTRNSECGICITEFEPQTSVITHPSCRNSFCAGCLLQWHASREQATCPICRENLAAELYAPGYGSDINELHYAKAGSQGLRELVGAEVFDRVPLIERNVRTRNVMEVEYDRVMASYTSRRALFNAEILNEWRLTDGIIRAQEYRFLDWRAAALCYAPVEPTVGVTANFNDLADSMIQRERHLRHVPNRAVGTWLRKILSTAEIRGRVLEADNASMKNISHVEGSYAGCPEYPIEWALYSPGDLSENVVYACPRKVFACIYLGIWHAPSKPGFLRSFVAQGGTRHVTPDPTCDPDLLYHHRALCDYRRAFPEVDSAGISTRLRLSTSAASYDDDLGLQQLFEDDSDNNDSSDNLSDDERLIDGALLSRHTSRELNDMFGID